jgi:hypothetical protein
MSSGQNVPSAGPDRVLPPQQDQRRQRRLALAALSLPAFFVTGFTLCYASALQAPAPHGVPVAAIGPVAQTAPLLILGAIGTLVAALAVFILLNFPSSGDSAAGPMLPTFWHVLNRFWIGASASGAFRGMVYFGGQGAGTGVLKLLAWLAVGVVLLALGWFKLQRGHQQATSAERSAAQPRIDSAWADQEGQPR